MAEHQLVLARHSLVPYGLERFDDNCLRIYFANPDEPQKASPGHARWHRGHDFYHSYPRWEFQFELKSFYRTGLGPWLAQSELAMDAYHLEHPDEPEPRTTSNAAYQAWVQRALATEPFKGWSTKFLSAIELGTATPMEILTFEEIQRSFASRLRDMADRCRKHYGWMDREARERQRLSEESHRKQIATANEQGTERPKRKRRQFGQLPPEPEVYRSRRSK